MENWIFDQAGRKKAIELLKELKSRETGGEVLLENSQVKITTYGRQSRTLKHLKETNSYILKP